MTVGDTKGIEPNRCYRDTGLSDDGVMLALVFLRLSGFQDCAAMIVSCLSLHREWIHNARKNGKSKL